MKSLIRNIRAYVSVSLLLLIVSCKKEFSSNTDNEELKYGDQTYLKLGSTEEFGNLLKQISRMDALQYQEWKTNHQLESIYDYYTMLEKKIAGEQNKAIELGADSSFFNMDNGILVSKNGLLLDKVLNREGVIQIGDKIQKFPDNIVETVLNKELQHTFEYEDNIHWLGNENLQTRPKRTIVHSFSKYIKIKLNNGAKNDYFKVNYTIYVNPNINLNTPK